MKICYSKAVAAFAAAIKSDANAAEAARIGAAMLTWKQGNRNAFLDCVGEILQEPQVQKLAEFHQHTAATTRYDHCVFVAYLSFLMCRRFGWDYEAAARGGMLHDLYHECWPGSENGALSRWRTHPAAALENARMFDLSLREEDIIIKHMWPVTLALPRYKESYIVSLADKIAAVMEKTHLVRALGVSRNLDLVKAAV